MSPVGVAGIGWGPATLAISLLSLEEPFQLGAGLAVTFSEPGCGEHVPVKGEQLLVFMAQ